MPRTKGSKNKSTIMRERTKEFKKEIKGLTQYEQVRRWFEEFKVVDSKLAKEMGWNTFRQRVATLRKNGYVINCDKRRGRYTLISRPVEVLKEEAYKGLDWFEPVDDCAQAKVEPNLCADYTQAKVEPVLWADVINHDNSKFIVDAPKEMRSVKNSRKQAVLDHLRAYGSINSSEALSKYDCLCLPQIIYALRKSGYNIERTSGKIVKGTSSKVDRDTSYFEYRLIEKPIEEVSNSDCKYMVVSVMNGTVLKLGIYDDNVSAEKGLSQARELYVNAFNNSANKGYSYLVENGSIIEVKKGLFKTKKELYTTFSIVEV